MTPTTARRHVHQPAAERSVAPSRSRRRAFLKAALASAASAAPLAGAGAAHAAQSQKRRASAHGEKHTVLVLNPGHFHAALTLRERHPRLNDDVYVYAEDGPDVEAFLGIVRTFNQRADRPTRWKLHVYRGGDYLQRLIAERAGDIVIVAGKNDVKMDAIHRLHVAGFSVLGDKPWLIDAAELPMLRQVVAGAPLAMDIMTERHQVTNRLQKALTARRDIFGAFRTDGSQPALHLSSVHHLYKIVNGQPLIRPAWFFDTGVQGEGMTDVTTHLTDLAQWMIGDGVAFDYARDIELQGAKQWPTRVPQETFTRITGMKEFPAALRDEVHDGALDYLCNAAFSCRMRRVPVYIEAVWALAVPPGGGDTHQSVARGSVAEVAIDQGPQTGYVPTVSVRPDGNAPQYRERLDAAVADLQGDFPGLGYEVAPGGFRMTIPGALQTGHETHFAEVLESFLDYVDTGHWPADLGSDLIAKYTLLASARTHSHQPHSR